MEEHNGSHALTLIRFGFWVLDFGLQGVLTKKRADQKGKQKRADSVPTLRELWLNLEDCMTGQSRRTGVMAAWNAWVKRLELPAFPELPADIGSFASHLLAHPPALCP